jgi:uncharacterized membrane protein YccC
LVGGTSWPILTVLLGDELVLITTIFLMSNTAVHSNAFGKLFDMILVTFFALGASFYLFFFTPLFSQIIATSHLQLPCHPLSQLY